MQAMPSVARRPAGAWAAVLLLGAVAIGGLWYVKWDPYAHKAMLALVRHSLGASILTGRSAMPPAPGWQAAWGFALAYFRDIGTAIVLGLLVGSGVQAVVSAALWRRLTGGRRGVALAAAASVPSMMCTCCSAPIVVGLAEQGVPPDTALVYWLGNPLLNPATLVFNAFVLGWRWAVLRLVFGLLLVVVLVPVGVRALAPRLRLVPAAVPPPPTASGSVWVRWARSLAGMTVRLMPEYAVMVLLLGALRGWLFPAAALAGRGGGALLVLAVAGTLFVVPTAGEVPIVQSLLHFGISPAASGVLLLTLPAVSLPSLILVGRALPARALAVVASAVAALGLLSGAAAAALHL